MFHRSPNHHTQGRVNSMFRPRKRSFWAIGDIKQPTNQPNGRLSKNRRHPKYLIIQRIYDPIELGLVEPKTRGANIGVAQQNADFWAKNPVFVDKNPSFLEINQIFCNHHGGTPKRQHSCVDFVVRRALRRPSGPFLARQYAFIAKPQPFSHHFLRSGGSDSMGS